MSLSRSDLYRPFRALHETFLKPTAKALGYSLPPLQGSGFGT